MSRDFIQQTQSTNPDLESAYNTFFTTENVSYISESITRILQEVLHRKIRVAPENIRNVMWEIYYHDISHPQIMIQKTINLIVNQIKDEEETIQHNNSLDPWIQTSEENYGMTQHDGQRIKLNDRKYQGLNFVVLR